MRFRGKLVDIGCIQHFSRVVGTISRLAKSCILRITPDKLFFILADRAVNGGVQIWCELPQGHFFDEFAMEGISLPDANEIYLEIIPENLVRALKTAACAKWVKIKLTRKHTPCLSVEVDLPSLSIHDRVVVHDIPVTVISRRLWTEFAEPEMPDFQVSICLPALKILRNVLERMKNLNNYVVLSANQSGEFKLMVETDMVAITTHFRDLANPSWNRDKDDGADDVQTPQDPKDFTQVRIDIRKFSQFISGQQVTPTRVICNLEHGRSSHFLMLHDDISLQYFIPAVTV